MIDIGKFAKPALSFDQKTLFRFSVDDPKQIAEELHKFATLVENGKVLIQKIQAGQIAARDDYFVQALLIEFAEEEENPDAKRLIPARIIEVT
jgi:hypothetical protein